MNFLSRHQSGATEKGSGTVLHNWKEADDNDHDALSSY